MCLQKNILFNVNDVTEFEQYYCWIYSFKKLSLFLLSLRVLQTELCNENFILTRILENNAYNKRHWKDPPLNWIFDTFLGNASCKSILIFLTDQ